MKSAEVVRGAVESVGAKKVAAAMNISASLVYKWCEGQGEGAADEASGALNPLDRVAALWDCTRDPRLVDWLCQRAGGTLVPDPQPDKEIDAAYVERTQRIIRDFSELLTTLSQSMIDDGRVDRKEAASIRQHWQILKQHGESFVVACERGNYDDRQNAAPPDDRPRSGPGRRPAPKA
jgi:hypothetical protein